MAKKTNRKTSNAETTGRSKVERELARDKAAMEKEMHRAGLNYKKVAGIIIAIIGLLLVLFNLAAVLTAVVGLILIYVGIRIFGYKINF